MYEFKRSKKIQDEIKIGDNTITINISADDIIRDFKKRHLEVIEADKQIRQMKKDGITGDNYNQALETFGIAIIALFQLIFGEENTEKILAFYENNYIEMIEQIVPYITENIIPKLQEVYTERAAAIKSKYVQKKKWLRK